MHRRIILVVALVFASACATEPKGTLDASPEPAATWWAWVAPGQVIGAAAPERVPGGAEAWLAALGEAAGDAPVAVLNLRVKAYPEVVEQVAASLHLPIQDYTPPTTAQADEALAFIEGQLAQGRVVVVHCQGGCGRTGTILAAWVKSQEGVSSNVAISMVREARACFVETPAQEAFVESYSAPGSTR
jgi:hypothetical protein